jgi:hypothetical protein
VRPRFFANSRFSVIARSEATKQSSRCRGHSLAQSRINSKYLALQIKAIEVGLLERTRDPATFRQ